MKVAYIAMSLVIAGGVCGCSPQEEAAREEFFPPLENSATADLTRAQAARGARADATLNLIHFDGAGLNSLGREKLNVMLLDADSSLPVTVYLNLKDTDAHTAGRRAAVAHHLADRGLKAEQFKLESGVNPGTNHPAAPEIQNTGRTDSNGGAAAANGAPANTAAGGSPGGAIQLKQ